MWRRLVIFYDRIAFSGKRVPSFAISKQLFFCIATPMYVLIGRLERAKWAHVQSGHDEKKQTKNEQSQKGI